MIHYSHIAKVPLEKVWEHLIFKIENPQHFVPGTSNIIIKEKNNDFVLRQMDIQTTDGVKNTVLEKITHSPYQVRFEIIEHPLFKGYVDNHAEYISENETKITYTLNWTNKNTGIGVNDENIVKNAVLKTVDYISTH